MSPDTFIGRHGLVRYDRQLGRRFSRSGACEVGVCRRARRESLACWRETRDRLSETLADLAACETRKSSLLIVRPATDADRRKRRRELDKAGLRLRALTAERDRLTRLASIPVPELPGPLVFEHCHAHGWVRGLACVPCNNLVADIDAGRAPRDDRDLSALLVHQAKCPGCIEQAAL